MRSGRLVRERREGERRTQLIYRAIGMPRNGFFSYGEFFWPQYPELKISISKKFRQPVFSCKMQLLKMLCPSVYWSVRPFIYGSVGKTFLKNREFGEFQVSLSEFEQIGENLEHLEFQVSSSEFEQIRENLEHFTNTRPCLSGFSFSKYQYNS